MPRKEAGPTPQQRADILENLRLYHTTTAAAGRTGIHRSTLDTWLRKGREAQGKPDAALTAMERKLRDFATEYEIAYDNAEADALEKAWLCATGKMQGQWQFWVTLLERTRYAQWGKRAELDVNQRLNITIVRPERGEDTRPIESVPRAEITAAEGESAATNERPAGLSESTGRPERKHWPSADHAAASSESTVAFERPASAGGHHQDRAPSRSP